MLSVLGLLTAAGCLETEEEVDLSEIGAEGVEVEVEIGDDGSVTVTDGEEQPAE